MTDAAYVRLRVGGEHYALPVTAVREVAPIGDVMPMPGAPVHVLGVRNVRGDVVPVIDLAAVAGLGGDRDPTIVTIVEDAGRRAGLAVDAVIDVGPLPEASEEPASPLLRGVAMADGELIGVIDPGALLTAAAWRHEA